jgi:hypothetical protein
MAAAGAPLRAIQEWMGHSNYQTTLAYADYAPDPSHGTAWAERAFGSRPNPTGFTSPLSHSPARGPFGRQRSVSLRVPLPQDARAGVT